MNRLALFLIRIATPRVDREALIGDTIERFNELRDAPGPETARRWLWRETGRIVVGSLRHYWAARPVHSLTPVDSRSSLVSSILQDTGYALRWFGRSPGFTAVAVLTLALGIGANTAMFAVVNAVMLKPLPFANADRLMLVHLLMPARDGGLREMVWSYPKYQTLLEVQRIFDDTALFSSRTYSLSGDGEPEQVRGEIVTERYLPVLGVQPVLGRSFTADEAHRPGLEAVVMIGHGLWTRRHGRDPAVLGRRVDIDGVAHTIVGVLPRGFRGLNGNAEIWMPLAVGEADNMQGAQNHSYSLVARRNADASEEAATAALRVYGAQIDEAHSGPGFVAGAWSVTARSLYDSRLDADLRRLSLVVLGAVGFVLLIACVNLTNLLVVKTMARHREMAIRVALGAGRGRIARQFGIESLLLSGAGAAGGLAVAVALLAIAGAVLPDADVFFQPMGFVGPQRIAGASGLTRVGADMIGLDAATLAFTVVVTLFTTVLVSILPALQTSALRPAHVLKAAGRTVTVRGFGGFGARAVLVGLEIAIALVLLVGAGLMLKSAMRLYSTSLGADPTNVLTAQIALPEARYNTETSLAFQETLVDRVRAVPGVDAAGWAFCLPVSGRCNGTIIEFPPQPRRDGDPLVGITWVTPGYFDALRIPMKEGRSFTDRDRAGQPKVVLVNETAARTFWPGESAVGKRVALFRDGAEVIGVVADVRYRGFEAPVGPDVYLPLAQSYRGRMHLVVRSRLDGRSLIATITREVRALDSALPLVGIDIKTMEERMGDAMWRTRVAAWLLSAFAGLALLLTAVGIFGVMAQMVAQRTAEIGIRMALGAQRQDVLALVLGRVALVTGLGLVAGTLAALALTRVLASLLHEVTPTDPATLVIVAFTLAAVSLAASYLPARRAMHVDATTALRSE